MSSDDQHQNHPSQPADSIDFATERREYQLGALRRDHLKVDPVEQFTDWLREARVSGIRDATAMTLATVDADGQPAQRMVLLKGLDRRGFVFFINLDSRKAGHIAANPRVSLHFAWLPIDRQVIIRGRASRLTVAEDTRYFLTRPRESQLAAWASRQSHPVTARRLLTEKWLEIRQRFAGGEVPLPRFWGGYRVMPQTVEFWQGRENRLHDRFEYRYREPAPDDASANATGEGSWEIVRLSP